MIYYVDDEQKFNSAITEIVLRDTMAVDTETTGVDPHNSILLMIQIGNSSSQYLFDMVRLQNAKVDLTRLKDYLRSPKKIKVFHNAKFDYKMIKKHLGVDMSGIQCTFVLEHLLKKGIRQKGFGLADVAKNYLNVDLDKSVRQTFEHHVLGSEFSDEQKEYCADDVRYLIDIRNAQQDLLRKWGIIPLAQLECQAVAPTGDMELNGVYLSPYDWRKLFRKSEEMRKEAEAILAEALKGAIAEYKKEIRATNVKKNAEKISKINSKKNPNQTGLDLGMENKEPLELAEQFTQKSDLFEVNLNSATQMIRILSIHLGREVESTEEEKLLAINDPIIPLVINFRKATKLCTTYGEAFLEKAVHKATGRIHTNFNQTRADSGRYSSSDPVNLQNIPRAKEYRAAFRVQEPNWKMISADYSGCELRLIAEICNEPKWIEALNAGYDMHSFVASMLFKIPYEQIVDEKHEVRPEYKEFRSKAKTINFGMKNE